MAYVRNQDGPGACDGDEVISRNGHRCFRFLHATRGYSRLTSVGISAEIFMNVLSTSHETAMLWSPPRTQMICAGFTYRVFREPSIVS